MTEATTDRRPSPTTYRQGRASVPARRHPDYGRTIGVLDLDGLHVAGRELAPCEAPPTLGDAYAIAAWFDLGALWITPRCAKLIELPDELDALDGPIDAGAEHPWATLYPKRWGLDVRPDELVAEPGPGRLAPWVNVYDPRNRRGTMVSVVLPHLDDRTAWHGARNGPELLRALHAFRRLLGTDYYWSTNATASTVVRESTRSLMPCEAIVYREVPPVETYRRPIPGQWTRPLSSLEDGGLLIVEYDSVAAHLSPIGSADLGIGEPVHHPRPAPPAGRPAPGYWRLAELPQWPAPLRPYLPPLTFADPDELWVPTPLYVFLAELGIDVRPTEAYLWPRNGRPYDGFYERCRTAREQLMAVRHTDPAAMLAYKSNAALYKSFWGYLARRGYTAPARGDDLRVRDMLWRPDHSHHIDTLSYCNMLRRVIRIGRESGRWPIALQNDAAHYISTNPYTDVPRGLVLGTKGGQWTAERVSFVSILREHIGEASFIRRYRNAAQTLPPVTN